MDLPVSDGAIRAFKRELESSNRMTLEPGSLAGAVLDVSPSSRNPLVEAAASSTPSAAAPPAPTSSSTAVAPPVRKPVSAALTALAVIAIVAALVALGRLLVQ